MRLGLALSQILRLRLLTLRNSASVLAPLSKRVGPSAQPPIGTSGDFPAHVSAESPSNIFHNPSEVISEVSELHDKSI